MTRQPSTIVLLALSATLSCNSRKDGDSPAEVQPARAAPLSVEQVEPLVAPPQGATVLRRPAIIPGRARMTAQYCVAGDAKTLGEKLAAHFRAAGWQVPEHAGPPIDRVLSLAKDGKRLFLTWQSKPGACKEAGEIAVALNLDPAAETSGGAAPASEAELKQLVPPPSDAHVMIAPQMFTTLDAVSGSYCLRGSPADRVQATLEQHFAGLGWAKVDTVSAQPSSFQARRGNVYVGVQWRRESTVDCTGADATSVYYSVRTHEPRAPGPAPASQ